MRADETPPQVVLMSATFDSRVFLDYFAIKHVPKPITVNANMRQFPVEVRYLDDVIQDLRHRYYLP